MTRAEIAAFLAGQSRVILVTNGADGFPHPMPMNYGIDDAGRLLCLSFAKSQKVRNLERDPRAALLVETGDAYAALRAVMIHARVEIIAPGPAFDAARACFAGKAQTTAGSSPERQAAIDASMAKRVMLRFTPERVISWDHGKLGGAY